MSLSSRSRALLKKIMYAQTPLRIKDLAEEFQVSERTIKYDLETVRSWLQEQRIDMQSKPNKGIWIECDQETRSRLLEQLAGADERSFLNQQERVSRIVLDLLLAGDPIPIGELAKMSEVTRNTILSDLLIAEAFFKDWDLVLERTRLGVHASATTKQRRTVLEHLVLELMDASDMVQIVQGVVKEPKSSLHFSKLLKHFLQSIPQLERLLQAIGRLTRETEREFGLLLSDTVIIGIFVRLCIVYRLHRRERESTDPVGKQEKLRSGSGAVLYGIFRMVLTGLEEDWSIAISEDGVSYVCLQAVGMISPFSNHGTRAEPEGPDPYILTKKLIKRVSLGMGADFQDDPDLFNNLLAHISDRLTKFSYGVVEPNPLLHEIVRSYPKMFDQVKRACAEAFGECGIEVTDPDIGFIVLHFQTAYEHKAEEPKVKALVVCATGRGTSRLVKTVVENEIDNIRVAAVCSLMELEKTLSASRYDLIISTFPITADVPVVVVSPILGKPDFLAIQKQLVKIGNARVASEEQNAGDNPQEISGHDARSERRFQKIIFKGFELGRLLLSRFGGRLTEERTEGLKLHLMFLMNRVTFGSQYVFDEAAVVGERADLSEIRKELCEMLRTMQISLTESELKAILRYFE